MRWRPRLGDVLLCAFALLLVLCIAHRVRLVDSMRQQARTDAIVFTRYVNHLPGYFGRTRITAGWTTDVVCATHHRPPPATPRSRDLCVRIFHGSARVRPVRAVHAVRMQTKKAPRWQRPTA
jgi:hypothetical protein